MILQTSPQPGTGRVDNSWQTDGQLNMTPANGGDASATSHVVGRGGNGAAGPFGAMTGDKIDIGENMSTEGGSGGGGFGRIRVNTASGKVRGTGVVSPPPSTGTLASR